MRSRALSRVFHTALAVGSVGLALLLAWSVPDRGTQSPALLLMAAVMVSAWVGGWGPGVLAAALSTIVLHYFLLPPSTPSPGTRRISSDCPPSPPWPA
jgi:K+-sensing histidine kinase KdpD